MNRDEAVLRELNLYPLWKLRARAVPAHADAPAPESMLQSRTVECASSVTTEIVEQAPAAVVEASEVAAVSVASGLDWSGLKAAVQGCTACKLRAGCTQTVFGVGDESADWLFVGEGPGAEEDKQGEPFVGQAGKLLDNMLMAIRLKRGEKVYIANVVKCRPPGNRTPDAEEMATCLPYLRRQIELIQPKVIVALGKTAANALLGRDASLGSLRGRQHVYLPAGQGGLSIQLVITYHPAYLLRTPADKARAWEDLCLAVKIREG